MKQSKCLFLCPFCGVHYEDTANIKPTAKYGDKIHNVCPCCGVSGSQIFIHRILNTDVF